MLTGRGRRIGARASEASHPAEALEVYTQRVESVVNSSSGYEEASRLIAHMAQIRSAAEQAAYVDGLKIPITDAEIS